MLTALTVPLSFLVAFFGINASQVKDTYSIWDYHHYGGAYLFALVLILVPFATLSFLRGRDLRRHARRRPPRNRSAGGVALGRLVDAIPTGDASVSQLLAPPVPGRPQD